MSNLPKTEDDLVDLLENAQEVGRRHHTWDWGAGFRRARCIRCGLKRAVGRIGFRNAEMFTTPLGEQALGPKVPPCAEATS